MENIWVVLDCQDDCFNQHEGPIHKIFKESDISISYIESKINDLYNRRIRFSMVQDEKNHAFFWNVEYLNDEGEWEENGEFSLVMKKYRLE